MATLFDHFESNDEMQIKSSSSSLMIQDNIVNESTLNSIGISGGAIFSLDKVQFNFPNNSIIDFDVKNNILVVACGSGSGMILIKIVERPGTRFVFGTLILDFGTLILDFGTLILDFGTLILDFGTLILANPNISCHSFWRQTNVSRADSLD
jgi:hypothetical protein